jgi:hypothetical protein
MQIAKPDPIIMCLILSIVQSTLIITLICLTVPEMVGDVLHSFFLLIEFYKFGLLNNLT